MYQIAYNRADYLGERIYVRCLHFSMAQWYQARLHRRWRKDMKKFGAYVRIDKIEE